MIRIPTVVPALLAATLLFPFAAAAQPGDDFARDAVDPYVPGKERTAFLRAAGADSELSEAEFADDAEARTGFARRFDEWATVKRFDRNGNGTIDWFEADAYRRSLRAAMLGEYDKNGDRRLAGAEREAANEALAKGKLPKLSVEPADAPAATTRPDDDDRRGRRGDRRQRFIERFDKDGDGELSDAEQVDAGAAMIREGRDRQVAKWDRNNDGVLDADERADVMEDERDRWWLRIDDIGMKHFDADGDNQLSEAESRDIAVFGQKLRDVGQKWEVNLLDADGDGDVSREERQAMRQTMQFVAISMMPKAIKWADLNGDGQVQPSEGRAVAMRVAEHAQAEVKKWTERFDANNDGRLDYDERDALIQGIDRDVADRVGRHDKDGDGRLAAPEIQTFLEELAEQYGVKPAEDRNGGTL